MRPEFECAESTAAQLSDAVQDRLARILDDYLVATEQGSPISPEELLRRHPEDAKYLRGYLSDLRLFHAAVAAPESASPGPLSGEVSQPIDTIGDYRLTREIGRGGMGVVYEALQVSLRRRVALKTLPLSATHDAKQIERFTNEAQAAALVQHPNIVPVYAVGEERGIHYYTMRLVGGQSLATMLAELHSGGAPSTVGTTAPNHLRTRWGEKTHDHQIAVPRTRATLANTATNGATIGDHVRAIARLGIQAAEALHAAHEHGIVHRDVKPSNLLLDDDSKLWVTDFGLARCREQKGLTQTGDILGTMRYMSPEQALGRGGLVDHRTDVYSLGVTLYELATLHHPAGKAADEAFVVDLATFRQKRLRHWNRHIPLDFETIVMRAIAELPQDRYASAREFADDLRRFVEDKPILASPPRLLSRAGKWARRHRSVVYAAATVLLVAFIGQSYSMLLLARKNAEKEQALIAADKNLRQAHAVLDRFGTQLVDQLAAIPGADGVRYQLLEDSLGLYRQLEQQAADSPALGTELALAYSKMGSLSEKMGKHEEALGKHLAARDIWAARFAEDPANSEYARRLALCHNNVGLMLAELGRGDEAIAALVEAEQIQRRLLKSDPELDDVSTDLATTLNNLGLVFRESGRIEDAVTKFRDAISLQEQIVRGAPQSESMLRSLAASYNNLASLFDVPANAAAVDVYQKAIAIQRKLVKDHPVNRLYQGDLARTYNNLGFVLAHSRDWPNAELCYANAVRIQENLVKASPLAASYRRDLAISYNNLGMAQSRGDHFAEAESSFQRALELQQALLAAEPADAKTLSNLGGVYNNVGLLNERQQRFADAEAAYRQAVHFQTEAFQAAPNVKTYRDFLSNHYVNYARCLRTQEKVQAADKISRERKTLLAGHQ